MLIGILCKENKLGVLGMKFGIFVAAVFLSALPLAAGTLFTVDPSLSTPTDAGIYAAGHILSITVTGTVNLDGPIGNPEGSIFTNPDGSLALVPDISCVPCWAPGYQYFIADSHAYPTVSGGDGVNHFAGGGGNYDMFPASHSPWAPEGKQTTDTTDPAALRFGSLAYTFVANPTATDWKLLGYGGNIPTGNGGTLQLVVVDTYYSNNSGSFDVDITEAPEPSAAFLAISGVALLGLVRLSGRR
jgi:hypothetical protein